MFRLLVALTQLASFFFFLSFVGVWCGGQVVVSLVRVCVCVCV